MKKRIISIVLALALIMSGNTMAWAAPEGEMVSKDVFEQGGNVENSEETRENLKSMEQSKEDLSEEAQNDESENITTQAEDIDIAGAEVKDPVLYNDASRVGTNERSLFAGGTGTAEDPFQIKTAEHMNNIRQNLSANYVLINDIDLSGYSNWEPIGSGETPFVGMFDGNNHTITGLTIIKKVEYVGLFGYCTGSLKNLKMKSATIDILDMEDGSSSIGVIAGFCSEILTCDVDGSSITVIGNYYNSIHVGGIIGRGLSIQSCSSAVVFNLSTIGPIYCGGIIADGGSIIDCTNYGQMDIVTDSYIQCGGITSSIFEYDNILRCINYADISATFNASRGQSYVGGIVAYAYDQIFKEASVKNCVNYGDLKGRENSLFDSWNFVAGIGSVGHGTISNCFNLGNITGDNNTAAYRISWASREEECYSLESVLVNGAIVTENIGADKPNGANLSEEEMLKKIEALGLDSDEEGTTTKKTIQGAIEHSYGSQTVDTKVEELLSEYVDDWRSAYIDYTYAVEEALMDSVEASAPTKKQAIKRRKEAMMEADSNSKNKEKYITGVFTDDKIKDAAYEGFSNFLYEIICSEIDISNISAEDINGTKLVNTILKSIKQASNSKTYKINGIKVTIKTAGIGDVYFGSITCNSSLFHTYVICSSTSQCQKAITNYMKELMGLTNSAVYQVYSSVCKDVLGVSLDKLTQKYLSQNLTKKVSKYASKFEASGIGNLATNLNDCYNYYHHFTTFS